MTPKIYWNLFVAIAIAAGVWYVLHLIRENASQKDAIVSLTAAVGTLNDRANRMDAAIVANDATDTQTRTQAAAGIARNETARRTDHATIAIDQPYPDAMRHRVFVNPDPASGSAETVEPAGAGARRGKVQKP